VDLGSLIEQNRRIYQFFKVSFLKYLSENKFLKAAVNQIIIVDINNISIRQKRYM